MLKTRSTVYDYGRMINSLNVDLVTEIVYYIAVKIQQGKILHIPFAYSTTAKSTKYIIAEFAI